MAPALDKSTDLWKRLKGKGIPRTGSECKIKLKARIEAHRKVMSSRKAPPLLSSSSLPQQVFIQSWSSEPLIAIWSAMAGTSGPTRRHPSPLSLWMYTLWCLYRMNLGSLQVHPCFKVAWLGKVTLESKGQNMQKREISDPGTSLDIENTVEARHGVMDAI